MSERQSSSTIRERGASPITWYVVLFVVLLMAAVVMTVRLGLDWAATNSRAADTLVGEQFQLKALEHETAPLRGLDHRVQETRDQLLAFEQKRIHRRSPGCFQCSPLAPAIHAGQAQRRSH